MKETEFNIWYNSFIAQLPKDNCIFNYDAKLGWNACRDKILEILEKANDEDNGTFLPAWTYREIEKL